MLKVQRHDRKFVVTNPANPTEQNTMVNVVFVEQDRPDFGSSIARSSAFLSSKSGTTVGLQNLRTHTQPILESELDKYPVGSEHEGFINRHMYSTPQIRRQSFVAPRMYDGNPTYFVTELAALPEADVDKRIPLATMAQFQPQAILQAVIGTAPVRDVQPAPTEAVPQGQQGVDADANAIINA